MHRNEYGPGCGIIGVCSRVYLQLYDYETKQNLPFDSRDVTNWRRRLYCQVGVHLSLYNPYRTGPTEEKCTVNNSSNSSSSRLLAERC